MAWTGLAAATTRIGDTGFHGGMDSFVLDSSWPNTQRRHLTSVLDSNTFKWAIIALSTVIGLFLLALIIWAIVTKCGRGRSSPVAPSANAAISKNGDVERGLSPATVPADKVAAGGMVTPPPSQIVSGQQTPPLGLPPGADPRPPWHGDPQRLPPGIMLTPVTPPSYNPLVSNPRLATDPPYERLLLISSRVHNADMVARSVLPNVAYVVYDWKNFTLQELLRYVKKVLGAQKVVSIGVVAPGSKPGTVGLLEGSGTSADKLATKTELSQFWRVLAGCVALSGTADGRRVDLLGCRVVEAPREGAALLKELWNLTTVPFAAADDALGGYMLCTFMEEPTTKQLSLISSTIPAIDLYFNRYVLLGVLPPGGEAAVSAGPPAASSAPTVASAPLPPGPPPPEAIAPVGTAPPLAAAPAAALGAAAAVGTAGAAAAAVTAAQSAPSPLPDNGVAAGAPQPQPAAPDVFSRLDQALQQAGKTPSAAFAEHDRDGNGQLSTAELTALMQAYLPDASAMDFKHFQAMLDTDALAAGQERLLSREEFTKGLPENVRIQELVRSGRDDDEVVLRLQEYLTDNEKILRDTFEQYDENKNGTLDHTEMQELVASIPGLEPHEKKFILAYLYHHDQDKDQSIGMDELLAALAQFGKPPPTIARAVPQPGLAPGVAAVAAGAAAGQAQAAALQAQAELAAQGAREQGQAAVAQGREQAEMAAQGAREHGQAAMGQVEGAASDAAQSMQERAQAAASALPPHLPMKPALEPLGGRMGALAPIGGALPRPGGLAPLPL